MNYPKGAIRTTEEMQALLGKPVYLVVSASAAREVPRVAPSIIKLCPVKIECNSNANHPHLLMVKEYVNAAHPRGIATQENWEIHWGLSEPTYYFSNFWFAYAYAQQRDNL